MFERVRRVRSVLHFVRDRVPHYGPLLTTDLHRFREEIVKATVGAGVSAAAGLIFACFLSVAVIVSTWDSGHRSSGGLARLLGLGGPRARGIGLRA